MAVARHTRHRVWPWVVSILALLMLVLAVVGGCGWKLYNEAKQVKVHEEQAMQLLGQVSDLSNLNNIDAVSQQVTKAQAETSAANTIAHGSLWNLASKLPVYGDDITTVQGMTSVVDSLVSDSVPQFMDTLNTLKNSQLTSGDGQLNLQPILEAQKSITAANTSLQKQVQRYRDLPTAHIDMVKSAYEQGNTKLTKMADTIDQMSKTFQILPDFLGSGEPRHYALMAMTTSEERSSGGLIGSVGMVTTDNGKISIGDFRSNSDYVPYGSGDPTSDESRIFTTWGPLHMSFDVRDLAAYPDTSRTAEGMRAIWQRTPWGAETQLDGVLLVDPVFLQELTNISGNITLSDGRVLDGSNTAEFLLNTVYMDYPIAETDAYFQQVAEQTVGSMFSNIDLTRLTKVAQLMGSMAKGRHFSMYSFDETVQKTINEAGFTAQTPSSEEHPQVGVYITEQNPSKMGWYIHRTSKITRSNCNGDGSQTYHVEYTMTNVLTSDQVWSLIDYIRGANQDQYGKGVEKTLIYAPAGGSLTNLQTSGGSVTDSRQETLNGKTVYASIATIAPGESVTYSFDVTTSTKAVSDLTVDQTPMGWADPGVTTDTAACSIDK
ncbi:chemotaxis protein [Bifidobacterium sp. DSM 109959]|uniref:Chemotaxis protein n=2 Tax=Bifidobacterium olomucense TaxID=2675324 RepID=A0A7Y0EVA8_9BIFI|nr:chemotaxis protein [Bifidobacterium sp. DSM 109959]